MFLSNSALQRPVAMCSLIIGLLLLGINSYRKLPLEFLPKVDAPFVTVVTIYPGASPREIETDVAKRIEDAVIAVDGLKHVTSSCMENICQTLLEFRLEIDIEEAIDDVREKIGLIVNEFPEDVEKPEVLKYDVNAKPIINLALAGEVSIDELYDYADNTLRDRLSVLPGVADIKLIGGAEREVNVLLDRDKLAASGLTSMDVVRAIQQGIQMIPSGRVRQDIMEYSVKFDAEYKNVSEIGNLEVANERKSRCYLKDLGKVIMTTDELRQASFIDGRQCIGIKVVKKGEANALEIVNLVRKTVEETQQTLPGGMQLIWISDDGAFIKASADTAIINIAQGIVLTAAVLFFFLYNFRSTLIVSITMPLTIIISLFFMHFLEFTLNISTLLAVGLSVGILVTNSIVVLESIVKRSIAEKDQLAGSRIGAAEVATAVLASAGTNMVVLFPIAMMGTIVGRFFRPFALTMAIVTVASFFISFTLTPILCSVLMRQKTSSQAKSLLGQMEAGWNSMFNKLSAGYVFLLRKLEYRRWMAAILIAAVIVFALYSFSIVPLIGFNFLPDLDKGDVYIKLEYPTYYNLRQTIDRVNEVETIFDDMPNLQHIFTTIGKVEGRVGQSSEGVHLAQILLKFNEKTERTESLGSILMKIRKSFHDYPESIVTVNIPPPVGGQSSPIDLEIAGEDLATLDRLAEKVEVLTREVDGIIDQDTSVRSGKPELRIRPRRAVLADLEAPVAGLGAALRANLEGIIAGSYKEGARTYDIRVKFAEIEGKDQVKSFLFPGWQGRSITLSNLADVEETLAPVQITRREKQRVSKVYGNLKAYLPMGTAINKLSALIDKEADLLQGYTYRFIGRAEMLEESKYEFLEAGILAIILTYLVLTAILESFLQPFVILFTIPLAMIGFVWALYLSGESLSIFVLVGAVMLIGIVVNNAILIMNRIKTHSAEGLSRHEAMIQAAVDELRPIIMITLAAILGMLPLAIGRGLGSEYRSGIGMAAIGGIFISGVLTLFLLPALYNLFTRGKEPS